MATFRVPYPSDPGRRADLFHRAAAALGRHGSYQGNPEGGTFQGTTPIGGFAGSYRALPETSELEIELTKKPWLVSAHLVEREVRKLLAQV